MLVRNALNIRKRGFYIKIYLIISFTGPSFKNPFDPNSILNQVDPFLYVTLRGHLKRINPSQSNSINQRGKSKIKFQLFTLHSRYCFKKFTSPFPKSHKEYFLQAYFSRITTPLFHYLEVGIYKCGMAFTAVPNKCIDL